MKNENLNIDMFSSLEIHDEEKEENVISKSKCIFIKISICIIYFTLIITVENFYREPLFNESIEIQKNIRSNRDKDSIFYQYWKFMSYFGEAKLILPIFGIIFLFFPLNSSFTIILVISYASYLTNFLKMIYQSERPYWKAKELDLVCESGYGNPSGHSLASTSLYLSLAHIVTNFDYFKKRLFFKIIIFCLLTIWAFLIMCSRFMLGAHSLNQILYGFTLGFGIYFIVIHIFSFHIISYDKFIKNILSKKLMILFSIIMILLILLSTLIYIFIGENKNLITYINKNIFNGDRCPKKNEYSKFKNNGFFQSLCITASLGSYYGLYLLFYLLKKKQYVIDGNIIEFNKSSVKRFFIRLPIILLSLIWFLINILVPGSSSLVLIFIFKSALSFFLVTFSVFSIGIFFSIYFNAANENISFIEVDILD